MPRPDYWVFYWVLLSDFLVFYLSHVLTNLFYHVIGNIVSGYRIGRFGYTFDPATKLYKCGCGSRSSLEEGVIKFHALNECGWTFRCICGKTLFSRSGMSNHITYAHRQDDRRAIKMQIIAIPPKN